MEIKQLLKEDHDLVQEASLEIYELACQKASNSKYSTPNIVLNILSLAIFRLIYPLVPEEHENEIIVNISRTLKANLTANRKLEKEMNEKRTDVP